MFETTIKPSSELKAALARIEQLKADGARIEGAIQKTRDSLRTAGATIEEARARLADAESNSALADVPTDPKARKQLLAARDEAEVLTARLTGLESKLSINQASMVEAQQAVERVWGEFSRAEVERFIAEEFDSLMGAFLESLQLLQALATATDNRLLLSVVRGIVIPDIADSRRNLADIRRMDWRQNERARGAFEQLSAIRSSVAGHPVVEQATPVPVG